MQAHKSRPIDALVLIASLLLLWQLGHQIAGATGLASPWATVQHAYELVLHRPDFWAHVRATLHALVLALALATAGGVGIGLVFGFHRLSGDVGEPMVMAVYSIPKVTLFPVILLFFGIGIAADVAFGVLHGIIPIILFTTNAVRNIHPVYIKTGRVLGLSRPVMAWTILMPAALPEIFTGVRVGFSLTLIGILISEMFGGKVGIGHLLMLAIDRHDSLRIMAVTLLTIVFAATINTILLAVERRLYHR